MMKGNPTMSHLPKALAVASLAGLLAGAAAGARAQPVDLGPGAPAQPDGAYVPYGQPQSAGPVVIYAPPAVPTFTYALLPGHWALRGASYVWVPPERVLRPVQTGALVPGRFAWRDGAYVWVPAHYN